MKKNNVNIVFMGTTEFAGGILTALLNNEYNVVGVVCQPDRIGNRKKLKSGLKNYKSATKFLKYAMQILNFVLSIATAVSALVSTGKMDFSSVLWATLSFILTLVAILFEVVKIIIRKNFSAIKQNFLDIREKPRKSSWLFKMDNEKEDR